MYTLFVDSDCDITKREADAYGAKFISMPYSIDGKTVYPYIDFEDFNAKEFYDMLRGGVIPTTSAISEEMYRQHFEPEFESGNDILYVHFSQNMTATFDFMNKALEKLLAKYPERKFYSIDTKGIATVSYTITKVVLDMYKDGKTPEEIVKWADEEVDHFAMYFVADDLKFFAKSGRVSGITAAMGNLLGVRPIINMSGDGKMDSIGKERGRKKALQRIAQYVADLGDNVVSYPVLIGHTDDLDLAQQLAEILREKISPDLDIRFREVNPTAGSHCGPNSAGVCFHAKHR